MILDSQVARADGCHHYYHYLASRTHLHYGEALLALGRTEEARRQFERAVFQDHRNPFALERERQLAGESPLQVTLHPYLDELFTTDAELRERLGLAVSDASQLAERDLEEALRREPEWGNFHRRKGEDFLQAGHYEAAAASLKRATDCIAAGHDAYHRHASNLHLRRAFRFLRENEPDLALADISKALDLDGKNRRALQWRAKIQALRRAQDAE